MGQAALTKEFSRKPPRESLDSVGALWRDYMWRYVDAGRGDPAGPFTAAAESLQQAVQRACDSKGEDGKMFFHQSKVKAADRDEYARRLTRRPAFQFLAVADTFEKVFDVCKSVGDDLHGIGPVTIYDVTARIAGYKGLTAVYLHFHAGVAEGLKALYGPNEVREVIPRGKVKRLHRTALPRFFWDKDADLIESFLCGYRSELERLRKERGW